MTRTLLSGAVSAFAAGVLVIGLAGCGGDSPDAGGSTSASAGSEATTSAAGGTSAGGASAGGPTASFLCDKIATALAGLPEDATGPRARADFASAVGEAYGADLGGMSGAKVDELLEGTCPDIHAEALERGEISGFADYL